MAAKLDVRQVTSAPVSSHGKRAATVKALSHVDTVTVTNRSRVLKTVGTKVSREAVKDFFLEEIAALALHIIIPIIAALIFYFVGREVSLPYAEPHHTTPTACYVTDGK